MRVIYRVLYREFHYGLLCVRYLSYTKHIRNQDGDMYHGHPLGTPMMMPYQGIS